MFIFASEKAKAGYQLQITAMTLPGIYFIYGLCVMFYFMMAWFFLRKNKELLSRLVAALMLVVGAQCLKDLFFFSSESGTTEYAWMMMTAVDMVAVPMYAFILIELCRPGTLRLRTMAIHEVPFVVLPLLFATTRHATFYYADVAWAAIYGVGYAVWTVTSIPQYHKRLKQRFSYDENINLNWLRIILISFFAILSLWILDCFAPDFDIEAIYMLGTLVIWMFICYFIYKHESVIDELTELTELSPASDGKNENESDTDALRTRIRHLFETEKIFLNPQLKLSDVAALAHSNRTYISRFFNNSHGKTFFEFVNEYRINHAMTLLKTTSERIETIAEQSGFNSRQSFHRVFSKIAGCTPEQFRNKANN